MIYGTINGMQKLGQIGQTDASPFSATINYHFYDHLLKRGRGREKERVPQDSGEGALQRI